MYRPSMLPVGLIALILSSSALAAEPTTPSDPFHNIAKFAQRPQEPPVCCLRPLPSSEPADEILSFEDWKTKQEQALLQQRQEQAEGSKPSGKANGHSSAPDAQQQPRFESGGADGPTPLEPPSPSPPPPQFRVPLTDRFNYASMDCSARVHYAHRSSRSSSSLLSSKKDKYMLSPCNTPGEDKFIVVELCEDIRIDTVQLANFEFFSGVFKDFSVSVARTYTTNPDEWASAGTYRAKNTRGIQSFHPPDSLRDFYRFIRIDFHSHYGNEFFCPISLLRVYGLTHLEQWKRELWEAEYEAKNSDVAVRSIAATAAGAVETSVRVEKVSSVEERATDFVIEPSSKAGGSASEATHTTSQANIVELASSEANSGTSHSDSHTTESSTRNEAPNSTGEAKQSAQSERSDKDAPVSSVEYHDSFSTTSTSSSSSHGQPTPDLPPDSIVLEYTAASAPNSDSSSSASNQRPSSTSSSLTSSPPVTTIVPHESRSVPTVSATGESIYRTIMTRLSLLEGNSTLYLRYVEEQTRSLRDALTRVEEDVGRLHGMSKAQTQSFQKIINEMDRQRRRLEREHGELQTRVDYLTDEVILEKRLGIAQLCLLLIVLVFMAVTRGSRGEPFITEVSSGRKRDALRDWGRRHLSSFSSGEWATKLRTDNSVTLVDDFVKSPVPVKKSDKVKFPSDETLESADRTPHGSTTNLTATSSARGRVPPELRIAHPRQFVAHRPRTPTSANFSVYTHTQRSSGQLHYANNSAVSSTSGQGSGKPRLRRASSQSTPVPVVQSLSVGDSMTVTTGSAKKWANSAHLHEVRKAGRKHGHESSQRIVAGSKSGMPTTEKPHVDIENANINAPVESSKKPWAGLPSDRLNRVQSEVRNAVTGRGDGVRREPLSISPLQNRSRFGELDEAGLDRARPGQLNDANGGPRIIDLDTESESWVDTDVEGSEVEDRVSEK